MRNLLRIPYLVSSLLSTVECGRIKSLFSQYPEFGEDLLIAAFDERGESEFLLSETEDLMQELVEEFPDWLETR